MGWVGEGLVGIHRVFAAVSLAPRPTHAGQIRSCSGLPPTIYLSAHVHGVTQCYSSMTLLGIDKVGERTHERSRLLHREIINGAAGLCLALLTALTTTIRGARAKVLTKRIGFYRLRVVVDFDARERVLVDEPQRAISLKAA